MPTLENVLDIPDPAALPPRTQALLRGWYGRDPRLVAADQVRAAVRALRWARTAGGLDYLPQDIRAERIAAASNALSVDPDHLVRLLVTVDELLRDLDEQKARTELIVAFEGLDSSGKTTQIAILKSELESRGIPCRAASSPRYESFVGSEILNRLHGSENGASTTDPRSMALWYTTDRWRHFNDLQLPIAGGITILNRFTLSNAVYQSSRAEESQRLQMFAWVTELEQNVFELPHPDLTFVLDVDPQESLSRSRDRIADDDRASAPDVYERSLELQVVAREMYRVAAAEDSTVHVLRGTSDPLEIAREVMAIIDDSLTQ